ncbi:MAG: hypothetical protein IKR81_08945, partial [Victivallales bacterium]|nr:hypothetical protein [Victivallales bacterium]
MKKLCMLRGGLFLLAVLVLCVNGCRKKEAVSAPPAEEPAQEAVQEATIQEEATPKVEETQEEKQKKVLTSLCEVEQVMPASLLQPNTLGLITQNSQSFVADDEADVVFPKKLGRFEMGFGGVPPSGMSINDAKQRPYSLSFDSDELASSA